MTLSKKNIKAVVGGWLNKIIDSFIFGFVVSTVMMFFDVLIYIQL